MKKRSCLVAAVLSAALLGACSDTETQDQGGDTGSGGTDSNGTGNPGIPTVDRRLRQFDNSEAFYSALRDALINHNTGYYSEEDAVALPVVEADSAAAPPSAPGTDAAASDSGSQESGSGSNVTSTTVQEVGVDEQDRVKISADGSRLYVLDSTYSYADGPVPIPEPVVTDSAIEVADSSMPAPQDFQTVLRIMGVDAETPDTQSLAEITLDQHKGYADGFYLYETGGQTKAIVTSTGGNYWANWQEPTAFAGLYSDISRVDVTDPQTAAVESGFQIEGQVVSSRRIGKYLFFASRFFPAIPGDQPWEQSQEQWQQTVESTDLTTVLPQYRSLNSDETTPLVDPASCFVANKGEDQPYYSPDIITLGAIDLDTMELTDTECYLGSSETLYASPEAVYLATTQYSYVEGPVTTDGRPVDVDDVLVDQSEPEPWYDPRVDTDIHQFDIDNGNLVYIGSGSVRGHLGWNPTRKPFRMSEHNGYLRVATMNDQQAAEFSPIILSVLQPDGQGNLNLVSSLPNDSRPAHIGKPGEQLYASRFLGDRAYLVTFRRTDPLYVIDLANPADPAIAGELEITGYSDYLFPLDANHLFAVGMDAVPAPDDFGDGFGALVQGIKLSLFDVSNPAAPSEISTVLVGQRGTYSEALNNHRAITIQRPVSADQPTRVSFGINVHGTADAVTPAADQSAWNYYPWSYTGLHGFDVQIGPNAGIVKRGAMVVETPGNSTPYGPSYGNDRSAMVDDAVFYIHGRDVYAAHWDDLSNSSPAR